MDFVEYDMTTGAETYFTVTVPGEDTGDLTMQGLAGEPEDADGDLTMPGYQGRPDPTPATAKKKNCWVKKGSYYYYYNSRGKLLRNGTYQIKGKNYCFDKIWTPPERQDPQYGRQLQHLFQEDRRGSFEIFSAEDHFNFKKYLKRDRLQSG